MEEKLLKKPLMDRYRTIVEEFNYPYKGIFCPANNPCGKILFVGYNPSLGKDPNADCCTPFEELPDNDSFWEPVKKLSKNVIDDVAFLDLFPVHMSRQPDLEQTKYNLFRAKLLEITQEEIENHIQPKLIVVLNRTASYYWGLNDKALWMGYDFQRSEFEAVRGNHIYKICGYKASSERNIRINIDRFSESSSKLIENKTHVLFYRQLKAPKGMQYPIESVITPNELEEIWNKIKQLP